MTKIFFKPKPIARPITVHGINSKARGESSLDHADQVGGGDYFLVALHEDGVYFGWHNKQLRDEVSHIAQRVHASACRIDPENRFLEQDHGVCKTIGPLCWPLHHR